MDIEHGLICSIVELGDLETPLKHHIRGDFFNNDEHRKVWEMLIDHWNQYGTVAEESALHRAYPNYEFKSPSEPIMYYIDGVKDEHKFRAVTEAWDNVADEFDAGGPQRGTRLSDALKQTLRGIDDDHPPGEHVAWWAKFDARAALIAGRKATPGYLRGISTSFDTIDKVTGGFQPEQLITMVSLPKGGKSTFALKCALEASLQGYRTVFFTFEMSADEQEDRLTSFLSGVGLTPILNGTINTAEMKRINDEVKLHRNRSGFTIVADTASVTTVSAIQSVIKMEEPHFVVIDGCYLMDDELGEPKMSARALSNIVQSLKRVAQAEKVPILCTTQALYSRSKMGVQADSIGYTSAFVQSSDVVLGIDLLGEKARKFKVLASRSGPRDDAFVHLDWTSGTIEEVDEAVAEQLVAAAPGPGKAKGIIP